MGGAGWRNRRRERTATLTQECAAGLLPVRIETNDARRSVHVRAPPGGDFSVRCDDHRPVLAAAIRGLSLGAQAPALWNNGPAWWLVELADERAVRALQPDLAAIARIDQRQRRGRPRRLRPHAGRPSDHQLVVRAFCPADNIPEDPVTGSANACIAAQLAQAGALAGQRRTLHRQPGSRTRSRRRGRRRSRCRRRSLDRRRGAVRDRRLASSGPTRCRSARDEPPLRAARCLRRPARRRQSAGGRARCRRAGRRHDAGDRALDAPAGDDVRVCRRRTPGASYGMRIFSPRREVPFAGHPSVGTAHAVLEAGLAQPRDGLLVQEGHRGTAAAAGGRRRRAARTIAVRTPPRG